MLLATKYAKNAKRYGALPPCPKTFVTFVLFAAQITSHYQLPTINYQLTGKER